MRWRSLLLGCGLALGGCSDSGGNGPTGDGVQDGPCAATALVGAFETALQDGFTSVQGRVESAVTPMRVPELVAEDGGCRMYRPPTLFCDPACGSGATCDATGACVATPSAVSVGIVTVSGLKAPVQMTPTAPVFFYTNTGTLEHPGFEEGAALTLVAAGDGELDPFTLDARGVARLSTPAASVALVQDQSVGLQWTAPGEPDLSTIHIDLDIAQHGGTPGWIQCEVPDTGSFSIPVALSNQLLAQGASGFPSLTLTRRSVDSTDTIHGCVQWSAQSSVTLDVEIEGLTSCSDNDDCTAPETCQPDLTCG
ncbi:MAG TPA: hypothetical protein VML75_04640 [Kofleriaceae bacterium]|nr:hypothetical protein [Kofleriaceae bacterium]